MIRPVGKSEYQRLAEIWESAVRATHTFLKRDDFEFYKSHLSEYFSYVDLYGFEESGRISGFIGVRDDKAEMLFVEAGSRGSGVGRKLMEAAVQNLGVRKVDVNEQNEDAVGFYTHMGFQVVSRSETDSEGKPYPILYLELL